MLNALQVDADGLPTGKLAGDSLTACEKIGSTATTVEEVKADEKVPYTSYACTKYTKQLYISAIPTAVVQRDSSSGSLDFWWSNVNVPRV